MNFDIRTLSIMTAVSALVFAFSCITLSHLVPKQRYLRDWAVGTGLAAVSTFLVGLRGVAPDMLSAAIANTLLTLAMCYLYVGTRGLLLRERPGRWLWWFAIFALVALTWFTVVQPSVGARVVIVSLVLTPLLAMTGFEFLRYDRSQGPTPLRIANRFTVFVYAFGVVLFMARIAPVMSAQGVTNYVTSNSALLVAPYILAILFNVWLSIMVTLTVSARLQHELEAARDLAQASSVAKSQFLANMSHEIRTPMNAILGMLTLLKGTELTTRQFDYAHKTEGAARALLGVINDILDFSKVEAGKMELDRQPFGLEELLQNLSVVLSSSAGAKNIEVLFDVDPAIPPVLEGDSMRLSQVLINLGGNAIKFTSQGQVVISIGLKHRSETVATLEFAVQDTGIGIAPENQGHIFDGFSQAEASTTRRFGGTGLGLVISQRMVALMGGALRLSSTLGEGSTFFFELDMAVAAPTAMPESTQPAGSGDAARPERTALVVDDNAVAAALTAKMIRAWGWPVATAHSGEQALQMIAAVPASQAFPYQVIYLDWHMPGMDGWETAKRIVELRRAYAGAAPALVMMTSQMRAALAQRSADEQRLLSSFLVKPVTAIMLRDAALSTPSAESRVRGAERARARPRRLQGMRLLVVEDNPINQQVAQELLTQEGALVSVAANGQLGVDAVAAANPQFDAVLMDVQMPVMDGYAATRAVRTQLGLASLPVIAMTANVMASDREACLAAGMDEHIGKPFDLARLVSLLIRLAGTGLDPAHPTASAPAPAAESESDPACSAPPQETEIDVKGALARLGGLKSLYLSVLGEYVKELPVVVSTFLELAQTDLKAAARYMHTFKGTSATMGAMQLSATAAVFESLCKSGADGDAIALQAPSLQAQVQAAELALARVAAQLSST